MIDLNIHNEVDRLRSVIVGLAHSFGGTPTIEDCYDPKSIEHVKKGIFPTEQAIKEAIRAFIDVLENYDVMVYQPQNLENQNQVFARDIAFVVKDRLVAPRIVKQRQNEVFGIQYIKDQIKPGHLVESPENVNIEGGDVLMVNDKIVVGYSDEEDFNKYVVARTNEVGVEFLNDTFKDLEIIPVRLIKSDEDPRESILHLDCCFQPVGKDMALIYPEGFKHVSDYEKIKALFSPDKLITINKEEAYQMNTNVFSIDKNVVVSEASFSRVNKLLRDHGITVEEVHYAEVSKMGGLFRCSTLPLFRD